MDDQLHARVNPYVQHIVQAPAPHAGKPNPHLTYSGDYLPRYHTLAPIPRNLPVPPSSPDANQVPPFHPHPGSP